MAGSPVDIHRVQGWASARDERGFTVVEVAVVLLIIGVLAAIGAPSFLGARERAYGVPTESALRAASKAAFVYAVDADRFDDSDAARAALEIIEPSLSFVDGSSPSTDATIVSVAEDAGGVELALAARSADGVCYYMRLSQITQETTYSDEPGECRAVDYVDGPNRGW